jgi:DNA-binding NarL/FixJ family response regulator
VATISVLVVDDHPLFADALRARLAREPDLDPVRVSYGAADARERAGADQPAVAVLDVMLADGDGVELAHDIRELSPSTRVLMLTAVEPAGQVCHALTHGARGWLPKTVPTAHLVRVIRGVHDGEGWLSPDLLGRVLTDLVDGRAAPPPDPLAGLTAREREVLQCMVEGLSRAEIAMRMRVSVNTVRTHAQNLLGKLGTHSVLESVAVALRSGVRASGG